MRNFKQQGFTLIELLVVIAVIGILASVILASLSSGRDKSTDAAIKSQLHLAQSQVAIYAQNNNSSYAGACTNGTIAAFIQATADKLGTGKSVNNNIGTAFTYSTTGATVGVCHDSAAGWVTIISLKTPKTANAGWCIDSDGASKEATSVPANQVTC